MHGPGPSVVRGQKLVAVPSCHLLRRYFVCLAWTVGCLWRLLSLCEARTVWQGSLADAAAVERLCAPPGWVAPAVAACDRA